MAQVPWVQAFARTHRVAVIAVDLDTSRVGSSSATTSNLSNLLSAAATASGRASLVNAPLLPLGMSFGGINSSGLAALAPAFADPAPSAGILLQVGGEQWYKNRPGLLALYAALRRQLTPCPRLVMVGPPLDATLTALARKLNLTAHITHLSNVGGDQLEALYNLAEGLLFPSLAEGFGWPVAEAQACGCPVFASDRAPITEVGGAHAVYFDPADPAGAARVIAAAWPRKQTLVGLAYVGARRWRPDLMIATYEALYLRLAK